MSAVATPLSNPHRPDTKNVSFTLYTEHHQEQAHGLPPSALHVWQHLLTQQPGGTQQNISVGELRDEISKGRRKPYHIQTIKNAIKILESKGLIEVIKQFSKSVMCVIANHVGGVISVANKIAKTQINLEKHKKNCKIGHSNTDSLVAITENTEIAEQLAAAASDQIEKTEEVNKGVIASESVESTEQIENLEAEEICRALRDAGLFNPQIKAIALRSTLQEVNKAIALLQEREKKTSSKPNNRYGLFTDCLKNKYWLDSQVEAKQDKHPQQNDYVPDQDMVKAFKGITVKKVEPPSEQTPSENQTYSFEKLREILDIKQTQWLHAPIMRPGIIKWVNETERVILGDNGPELVDIPLEEVTISSPIQETAGIPDETHTDQTCEIESPDIYMSDLQAEPEVLEAKVDVEVDTHSPDVTQGLTNISSTPTQINISDQVSDQTHNDNWQKYRASKSALSTYQEPSPYSKGQKVMYESKEYTVIASMPDRTQLDGIDKAVWNIDISPIKSEVLI